MTYRKSITKVAIFGGDPVVARTLKLLLQEAGYEILLIEEPASGRVQCPLEGVRLLLLPPAINTERRKAFFDAKEDTPPTANIPILTLGFSCDESQSKQWGYVPWPNHVDDLKRVIDAALTAEDFTTAGPHVTSDN